MKRRGHPPREMIALLATGAAMADTVPPSIVLIVLGAAAGVSIAGLFTAGITVAMVLLLALAVLARWNSRHENLEGVRRAPGAVIGRTLLLAVPALVLPFLIRSAVTGGVATATEVSTIAVLYALFIGVVLYGGIGWRKLYDMFVETAALTGAILLILGTALAMAWAITQAGVAQNIATFMTGLPGGWVSFMAVSIVVFLLLGCILEGLPAIVLMAPLMFPIAKSLGINDVHYSMVVVTAMNIGLMTPPIGGRLLSRLQDRKRTAGRGDRRDLAVPHRAPRRAGHRRRRPVDLDRVLMIELRNNARNQQRSLRKEEAQK